MSDLSRCVVVYGQNCDMNGIEKNILKKKCSIFLHQIIKDNWIKLKRNIYIMFLPYFLYMHINYKYSRTILIQTNWGSSRFRFYCINNKQQLQTELFIYEFFSLFNYFIMYMNNIHFVQLNLLKTFINTKNNNINIKPLSYKSLIKSVLIYGTQAMAPLHFI